MQLYLVLIFILSSALSFAKNSVEERAATNLGLTPEKAIQFVMEAYTETEIAAIFEVSKIVYLREGCTLIEVASSLKLTTVCRANAALNIDRREQASVFYLDGCIKGKLKSEDPSVLLCSY